MLDYDKREVAAHIRAQRARTVASLEDLAPDAWETIVTPGWRVREVAAHLVSADEAALTGRMLALGFRQVPVSELEAWNDEAVRRWADRPIPELLAGLERWGRRITGLLGASPGPLARARLPLPFGRVSLAWLGMMRVYDEWIHLEDLRRAFAWPADDSPEAVEPVARHLLAGIPVQTLGRVPESATGAVTIAFEDVDVAPLGVDLGARRFGWALAGTGTTIAARAGALVMVAAGRDRWRDAEEAGDLRIEGPREPAESFLDALLLV